MKNNILLFVAILFCFSSFGQLSSTDYSKQYASLMNTKNKTSDVQGSPFLYDDWTSGVVVFKGEEGGKFDKIKINLLDNQLEVEYMKIEKVLPFNDFIMLQLNHPQTHKNTFFQKASKFKYKDKRLRGWAKVTPIGKDYKVIVIHSIRVIEPSMNAKIVGAKHKKRIAKEKKIFVSKKGKLYRVNKRKKFFKVFTRKQKKLKAFVGKHDLSVKKEQDLIKMIEFYHKITKK